ncbi:MAG: glycosyltransferase family 2 protein [Acidiferrobacteraceae bacterium]
MNQLSLVIPVFREDPAALASLIERIRAVSIALPGLLEVILVDDGCDPPLPASLARGLVRIVRHPRNMGNGAAVKTGARAARGDIIAFMDGDGQHDPADIPRLLAALDEGHDMVVGARAPAAHASFGRRLANGIYNRLASWMTGYRIDDLTSGFRVARLARFRRFLYLLPNGFSYPTTSTMAFFRSGFSVGYVPIDVQRRTGASKIGVIKDGTRFFLIILKIGALFSPMRLFLPAGAVFFGLGLARYLYTFITEHRLTNMSAILFVASTFTMLIGVVSEQVSALHYKDAEREDDAERERSIVSEQMARNRVPNEAQENARAKPAQRSASIVRTPER